MKVTIHHTKERDIKSNAVHFKIQQPRKGFQRTKQQQDRDPALASSPQHPETSQPVNWREATGLESVTFPF